MLNQNSLSSARTPFKQTSFIPYNTDSWVERWFPVRETDGATRVAESGTIHITYTPEGMKLAFSPIIEIDESLVVTVNGDEISNDNVVMKPSEVLKKDYEGVTEQEKLEIYLGSELLYSTEVSYIIDRPHTSPTDALDDPFILARELENRRSYGKALDTYLELLEKEPMRIDASERVAELYSRQGDYDLANQYIRKVLEIDAYQPEANFIYGTIRKAAGNFADARDGFRWAMRSLEFRSAALQQLSEINLMEGNPELAIKQALEALSFNEFNMNSYKIQAIAQRIMDNSGQADAILDKILEMDPLDHFALFEKYLLKTSSRNLKAFNASFKSEMTKEEYLETGLFYARLGMDNEAVQVLEEAPGYPVSDYWMAWLTRDDKERSVQYLEKALEASPEYVFPYRTETLQVLEWASKESPSWITDYYAALILWNVERDDEALSLLENWGDQSDFIPFYFSRAYLAGIGSDAALEDMKRAYAIDHGEWRIIRELTDMYVSRGNYTTALALVKTGHERFPENYILDLKYSKCLTLTGDYQGSLDVLTKTKVLPFEGENTGQRLFAYNHLMLAFDHYRNGKYEMALSQIDQSEAYPENLGSGSPYLPNYRNQYILRKMIYDRTGERSKSREAQETIRTYDEKFGKQKGRNIFQRTFTESNEVPF